MSADTAVEIFGVVALLGGFVLAVVAAWQLIPQAGMAALGAGLVWVGWRFIDAD